MHVLFCIRLRGLSTITFQIGIRFGHFYAWSLINGLKLPSTDDGVVRISLVHYNTVEEVHKIIEILKEILD